MANYYNDNPNLQFYLDHPLMKRIVELKERNFADKDTYDYAPVDYEDAMENYRRVLDITGDITANIIEPNSESVDLEGPHLENGRMIYASKTVENLDACTKGGLWGVSMPRRYGGLNLPITVFSMLSEMVASADAGFQNIWSLQSCIDTLYEFGNEEQRMKYIPRVCAGETMSMDLTEPDAGSDLQSVMLKATYSEKDGCWLLNGVKRFITNGDSDIHLVLARSEEGTKDGRGLSMFIYDKRQGGVNVRHIEHKLGIHGSPTCELTYKNAKAELCGETRLGLIKYVMALMNSARLGIAAQSVGLGQEAYNEALRYAGERQQFHKKIIEDKPNYKFVRMDICDFDAFYKLMQDEKIDGIIHLAAESHVDRSIKDPFSFARTNVMGTLTLLQAAMLYWESLPEKYEGKRFYHISTDEVYGALKMTHPEGIEPPFTTKASSSQHHEAYGEDFFYETTKYNPHSPYSASKASSDHFVRAFHDTYGMPTIVTNCSNNYGPYQFPEKLIPLFINNIRNRKPLPVYGKGENVRDWLFVEDHARAIDLIFHKGTVAETYNIGGFNEWKNIDIIKVVINTVDRLLGRKEGEDMNLITYVTDRLGHDARYAIDSTKLQKELGWEPSLQFEEGIEKTVKWYLENQEWMDNITSGDYEKYYDDMYKNR